MPLYRVRHTYVLQMDFYIEEPSRPDALRIAKNSLPEKFTADPGPLQKHKINHHHVGWEVDIVTAENAEKESL